MISTIVTHLGRQWSRYFSSSMIRYRQQSTKGIIMNNDLLKSESGVNGKRREKKNHQSHVRVVQQLSKFGYNIENIPTESLKEIVLIKHLHLIDKLVAEKFASLIAPDLAEANAPVFEGNPGMGYLTEKLLEARVPRVYLFEVLSDYTPNLMSLVAKYPDRLSVQSHDIFRIGKLAFKDKIGETQVFRRIMRCVPKNEWHDEPSLHIVGALTRKQFLYYLCHASISGDLSEYGRVALYLTVEPSISRLFAETKMTNFHVSNNILLQLFFDYEKLGTLPRYAFLPWLKKIKKNQRHSEDNELMHVVKLVPKLDFFNDDFTRSDVTDFYYFLVLNMKSSRVIPKFEEWIPGCGPRLIKMNFDIFTKFKQLSALELLNLFMTFKSWPEYKNCVFLSIVQDLQSGAQC